MVNCKRLKLKAKIFEKYDTITDLCNDIGVTIFFVSKVLSGTLKGNDDFWLKIKEKLDIPDSEIEEYKSTKYNDSKIFIRRKLKCKIREKFGKIQDFCNYVGLTKNLISNICSYKRHGSFETWFKIQEALNIPDEEMWSYIKGEEVKNRYGEQ